MMIVPMRGPVTAGVKVTSIWQFAPGARLRGQSLVWVKSMPEALMSLIVTSSGLTLVRVADFGWLRTPTACESKSMFAGETARKLAERWL